MKALALKDPEFFKYLQENDKELLDFGNASEDAEDVDMSDDEEDDEDSEDDSEEEGNKKKKGKKVVKEVVVKQTPVLTKEIIRTWQASMLKVRLSFQLACRQPTTQIYYMNTDPIDPFVTEVITSFRCGSFVRWSWKYGRES